MRRTTRTCSTAMVLILAAAGPAFAQTTWSFSDIDRDGNLELSAAEFEAFGRDLFVSWDADADKVIGDDEFYGGVYDAWDVDDDDVLTDVEFATGLGETELYDTWAAGGELGEEEFVTGLYDVYDTDDDLVVTQAEYDEVGEFWTAGYAAAESIEVGEVISLADWTYDDLYTGFSADNFIDEMEVYGVGGEEIGDVEDIIIGPDGRILSIVAEVGGFWDIGDTHVSIPYDQVTFAAVGDGITVPVTEETVGEYGFDREVFTAGAAATEMVTGVDDAEVVRGWRATELIGDYARIREGDTYTDYGYVSDLILRDGEVAAVVVQPDAAYGVGYRAYPYYGYDAGYGWDAGSPYYDMPYEATEVIEEEEFDYGRFE